MTKDIRLAVIGDVVPPRELEPALTRCGSLAAFRHALWEPLGKVDLVVANLECPISSALEPRENKRYNFRAHRATGALFDDRFVLSIANNHIMDYGHDGLTETLQQLDARRLHYAGAGLTLNEACAPLIVKTGGSRIGLFCACDARYQSAGHGRSGTCPANSETLARALSEMRHMCDLVIVSYHMAMEFVPAPTALMRKMAVEAVAGGAHLVVFHHAHCVSGITIEGAGAVIWGSGNYLFAQSSLPTYFRPFFRSAVFRVTFDLAAKRIRAIDVVPVILDHSSFPCLAEGSIERHTRRTVERWSRRVKSRQSSAIAALGTLISPSYCRLVATNYWEIARRTGWRSVLQTMWSTITTQIRCRQERR